MMGDIDRAVATGRIECVCLAAPVPIGEDPILGVISNFRLFLADYNKNAPEDNERAELYAQTYKRSRRALIDWQEGALTRKGAIEALRLASDADKDGDFAIVGPMVRAALGYLDKPARK